MDDNGARSLIAAILKQAYTDYTSSDACPEFCEYKASCEKNKKPTTEYYSAKKFIRSAWCATMAVTSRPIVSRARSMTEL